MDYRQAVAYLEGLGNLEQRGAQAIASAHFDLRRMEALLERIEHPERRPLTVHIAGTKGKGSTAAILAAVLVAAGYRTGLYTSPHLHSVRERFRVNGTPISPEAFAAQAAALAPHIEAVNAEARYGKLTTFEAWTALAFRYFAEQGVDVTVLETGLGGRLDATNVAPARLCLLTSLSFDHTQVLGNTIEAIAREKAGIIKPGAVVISAPQAPKAMAVIEAACAERRAARLVRLGVDVTWRRVAHDLEGQRFAVRGLRGEYLLRVPLLGAHQGENLALAVAAAEQLATLGLAVSEEALVQGCAAVRWPGRMELVRRAPLVLLDGAHNAYSAQVLANALADLPYERAHLVFGASADKDLRGMARALAPRFATVTVTRASGPRAADPALLTQLFHEAGHAADVVSALGRALEQAGPRDLVCVTGSLFLVAEARAALRGSGEDEAEPFPAVPQSISR